MSEDDLESKQLYLREEIIDQGYDPSDFNLYMCNIRQEENIDLNNWTLEELKSVVTNYKESQASKVNEIKEENNNENQNDNNENQNDNNENQNNINENNQNNNTNTNEETNNNIDSGISVINLQNANPFDLYQKTGSCTKLEKNELTDREDLRVVISDPVKVNPGFFSLSYFQYKVTTYPLNFSTTRKLSDFLFLNEKLPLIHPVIYTPLFPVFHYGVKDDSPKKLRYIQNYMNLLMENIFFRSLPIVYDFLTLSLDDWTQKVKNEYSKITQAKGFDTMPNLEGKYLIKITQEDENKASLIKNEINTKNEGLKNLNYYLDELLALFDKISLTIKNISVCFFEMEKTEKNLNQNNIFIKGYNNLGNLFQTWSNDYLKQKDFIKDEIKYYFKFMSKEYKYILKNFNNYKGARDEYKKSFDKTKKNKNPTSEDLNMLKEIRKYYGYEMTCLNDEYIKLEKRMEKRLINQFMVFTQNKDIFFQDYENCIKLINFNNKDNNEENNNNNIEDNTYNENDNNIDNNNIEDNNVQSNENISSENN